MSEMRRSASLVCAWIMVLAGDMVRNWLTPTVGQFSCFCQLYAWRNGLSRTVDNGRQQSSAAELLPTAFAGASGTKLGAAGLYRHGLQGLTLMRALRQA